MSSLIRRYTPPTCTLEILGESSPLSRWAGRPVLNQVRFRLSLDDPRLPKDEHLVVEGDRDQLEALQAVVEAYVQNCLNQSEAGLDLGMGYAIASASGRSLTTDAPVATAPAPASTSTDISLSPNGALSHQLCLGSLTPTPTQVQLSTLQLFDLASALDTYVDEALALPDLPRVNWWQQNWGRIAALVVLGLGVATSGVKLLDGVQVATTPTGNAPTSSQGASSLDQQTIAVQPSTVPPAGTAQSAAAPFASPMVGPTPTASPSPGLSPVPGAPRGNIANVYPYPVGQLPSAGTVMLPPPPPPMNLPPPAPTTMSIPAPLPANPAARGSAAEQNNAEQNNSDMSLAAGAARTAPRKSGTAFDTIPQVAEARTYFEQRWQPPNTLTQTLEYRLLLNPDGSIRQIIPLGEAAGAFIDRTAMPLVGDPFVSPIEGNRTPMLRLVLGIDGKVQVFLESLN